MKLCEIHQPLPNGFSYKWPPRPLRRHQPGQRIYVHATALQHFTRKALHKIRHSFVMVTGNSVPDVSAESIGSEVIQAVLDHPLFDRWYVQNLDYDHPKMHPMPLGLDYHVMTRNTHPQWGPTASARAQEDTLQLVRKSGPRLADRAALGYSNWHFALNNGDRKEVIEALPKSSTFYEDQTVERTKSWQRNQDYFFTMSPRGVGMDCHRTWESILIGSVPIIPDQAIRRLFVDLPVVTVTDWAKVTPDFLQAEKGRILSETYEFSSVFLETWRRKFYGLPEVPPLRMRYQEFMDLTPDDLAAHTRLGF